MALASGLTSLSLPTLPKLGGLSRRKRYKPPRPEYSVDIEGERRKYPRISIEELSQRGADVLKEQYPDLPKTDRRSLFTKVTDILDIDRAPIARAIAELVGMDVSGKREGTFGIKKVYMSDVLEHLGVPKGPISAILGFVGDVAISPLTYYTLGGSAGLKLAKHLPRGVGAFVGMAKTAAKTGRAAPELAKALGTTAEKFAAFTARQVAKHGEKGARKIILGRGGGVIEKLLAKRATKGAPEALALLAKYGEKARPLFRLPFAKRGILEVLPGARKARYGAVVEEASEAGQRLVRGLQKVKKSAGAEAAKVIAGTSQLAKWQAKLAAAKTTLAQKEKELQQYLKAEFSGRSVGYPGTVTKKIPLRTHELRFAEKEVNTWKEIVTEVQKRYDAAKAIGGLKSKYDVSPAALKIMQKAPGEPSPGLLKKAYAGRHIAGYKLEQAIKSPLPLRPGLKAEGPLAKIAEYPLGKQRYRTPVQLAKTELAAVRPLEGKIKTLAPQVELASELAAKRANLVRRMEGATTGKLTPPILKQLNLAEMGRPLTRGQPGIISTLTRAKQKIFGPPVTPVRQQVVSVSQQMGPKAFSAGEAARVITAKQVAPIIEKYVRAGAGTKDEIGRLLFRLAEAGPELSGMKNLPLTDALRQSVAKAQQMGLADDPAIRKVLGDIWQMREVAGKAKGVAELEGYMPRLPEKITTQLFKKQKLRITDLPFRPERDRLLTFTSPTGQIDKFTSTSVGVKEKIAALRAKGWKKTAEEMISTEQMNLMAPEMTRFGPDKAMLKTKGAFKESLPEAAGSVVAQRERAIGVNQLKGLLSKHVIDFPKGGPEASPAYAGYARLKPRLDNPIYQELVKEGLVEGKAYPVQIADMIDGLTAVWDMPEMIEAMVRGTDRLLGIWKGFQLYHPAYLIRNVFQNFFGGLMAGANPANVTRHLSDSRTRALTNALATGDTTAIRGITKQVAGRDMPLESFYNFLKNYNAVNVGQTAAQVPRWKGPLGFVHRFNTSIENQMRIATFMDFTDKGMDMKSAFMKTLTAMPDLTDLTIFEREGLARLFPWYRWMRRNGALQLFHYLPQKPAYAAMLPKFQNFVEGLRGQDNVPEELRPMWMNEQAGIQIGGTKEAGRAWLAQTWFPFEEMYMLLGAPISPEESGRRLVSAARPGIKTLAEMATGTDIFRKTPLEPMGGVPGAIRKLPAALAGKSGTALDSLLALRPVRELSTRIPQMPSFGAGVERFFLGGAFQPVDYQRGLTAKYYELNKQQQQLRSMINRARQVNDEALAENLTRQWIAIIKQMHNYKFPLPRSLEKSLAGVPQTGPP